MDQPVQLGITRPESGLRSLLFENNLSSTPSQLTESQTAIATSMRHQAMISSGGMYAPSPIISLYDSAIRYDDPVLGFNPRRADQEDLYARNQSILGSVSAGLGRLATTTLTKTGASLGYLGAGIINGLYGNEGYSFEDKINSWMSRTADNAFSKFWNSLEEDIKNDYMPIYQDAADRDKGFWMRALTDLNFWTEDFSDGAAFMASAFLPGMLISKVGLGARAVRGLNALGLGRKIEQTAETAAAFNQGLKVTNTIDNTYDVLNTIPRVAKWISNAKLARNIDVGTQTFISTASESMVEAAETKHRVIENLQGKINPETGIEYTPEELTRIGAEAAMGTFKGNMVALAMSNLWEANLIFKKLPSTSGALGDKVKFAEGLTGAAEFVKPNYLKVFGKKAATGIFAEGLWEENVQLAISRFNEAKYSPNAANKKYSSSILDNFFNQTIDGLTGEDKEAAISIGLGAILGGIVGGTLSTRQDKAQDKILNNNVAQYNTIASSFKGLKDMYEYEDITVNGPDGTPVTTRQLKRDDQGRPVLNQNKLAEFQKSVVERTHLLELMNNAKDSNNETLANMYENELFSEFARAHFEMGNAEGLFEKLSNMQNIKEEDLAILGYDATNKEAAVQKIAQLKTKAQQLQGLYDDIQRNVLDNNKEPGITQERKKKLFQLGARQQFLIEEINKSKGRVMSSTNYAVNQVVANERAAAKRVEGLKVLSEGIGEIEEDVINEAEEDLIAAKAAKEKFMTENSELVKGLKVDPNGYLFDPTDNTRNRIAEEKQQDEMENFAGLNLALKETTNRFNKLADIRKGDKYTTSFIVQQRLDVPEKYADINEAEVDVEGLNGKLKVLLQNVRFDPITKEFPYIVDASMPLVARLGILQKLAEQGEPLAQEILDEFAPIIDKATELVEQMKEARLDRERQEALDKEAEKNQSENPGENVDESLPELAKKDVTQMATTVVVPDGEEREYDNYHLRHETYLSNLASKNYKGDASRARVIIVNEANQDKFGLPGLIVFKGTTDGDKALLAVHVEQAADGKIYFVDVNGERLGEFGQPVDYNKLVYGQMSSDNLTIQGTTDPRYRNESQVDEKQIQEWWRKTRGELLKVTDPTFYEFNTSAGRVKKSLMVEIDAQGKIPNINLTQSGLVTEEDFNKPILEVATDKTTALRNTNGITPETAAPKTTKGVVYLNINGALLPLKNSKFSEEEIDNIFKIILHIANEVAPRDPEARKNKRPVEEIFNDSPMQYLKSILYFGPRPGPNETPGSSRMWIQKGLGFKNPKTGELVNINFVPAAIEMREEMIKDFLREAFHQADRRVMLEQEKHAPKSAERKFIEVGIDNDNKPYIIREWESYNHYLLSPTNPDGSKREPKLKINMKQPIAGENVLVNRYIRPVGEPFKIDLVSLKKKEVAPIEKKEKKKEGKKPEGKPPVADKNGKVEVEYTATIMGTTYPISIKVPVKKDSYTGEDVILVKGADEIIAAFYENIIMTEPETLEKAVENYMKENPDSKLTVEELEQEFVLSTLQQVLAGAINSGRIVIPGRNSETPSTNPKQEVKQDGTTDGTNTRTEGGESEEDLLRRLNEGGAEGEAATRLALDKIYDSNYKVANINIEKAWFQKRFPQIPFEVMSRLIDLTDGAKAWGVLEDGMVKVYEKAEEGTTFHEGFEVVWNMFLTGGEQLKLFNDFIQRKGSFITYKGIRKNFADASVKEAKEQMAEEMRDWVLNGIEPPTKSHKNFFTRIWDWIVSLLTGRKDLKTIFERIDKGYYASRPILRAGTRTGVEAREVKDAPEAFVQDVLQMMTVQVFSDAFQEDSALLKSLESEGEIEASQTLYDKLKERLEFTFKNEVAAYFKEKIDTTSDADLKKKLTRDYLDIVRGDGKNGNAFGWQFVKDNWANFVTDHKRFLRSFNTKFELDEEGEIMTLDIDNLDTDESNENQNEYDRDIFTINAKNAASTYVKLLFATIADSEYTQIWKDIYQREKDLAKMEPYMFQTDAQGKTNHYKVRRESSAIKGAKVASYAQTFNYILHNVANSTSILSIHERMKNMAKDPRIQKNANVYRILSRMKMYLGFDNKSISQMKGILKIENALLKQKPEFWEQRYLKNGEVILNKSNFSTKTKEIAREWVENLKSATFVKVDKNNNFVFSDQLPHLHSTSADTLLAFGRALGIIQLTDEAYQSLPQVDKNKINSELTAIRNVISKTLGKPLSFISGKTVGIQARLENIADILMNKVLAEDNESQHKNNDGKATSNFVLNNWVSYLLNIANESMKKADFIRKVKWLDSEKGDIFSRDCALVNEKLYNEEGNRNIPIGIAVAEGIKSDQFGNRSISTMTIAERTMYEFNNNLRGIFNILLPADAKTEWVINSGTYIPITVYKQTLQREAAKQTYFYDRMRTYLNTEIALAKDFENRKHIENLNIKDRFDREVGKSLRFFKGILDAETVAKIHTEVIDGGKDISQVVSNEEIDKQVKAFLENKLGKTFNTLKDIGYIVQRDNEFRTIGFLTDIKEAIAGKGKTMSRQSLRDLLEYREMNYIINNIEMHKAFFGDPAQFADAEKRIKSFMSGRETTHHAVEGTTGFAEWANEKLNEGLQPGDIGYHYFKNHLNTATVYDVKVSSRDEVLGVLKEHIHPSLVKAYEKNNEADAASWMSPTAYRELLYRAGGRFTAGQEELFQWHMAYERFVKNKLGEYEYSSSELYQKDIKTLNAKNIANSPLTAETRDILKRSKPSGSIFQVLKPIVSGIIFESGVARTDLVKTATMPLFYEWVEGVQLKDVYNLMQERGLDYLPIESAHKVGMTSDNTTNLYNKDGTINKEGLKATRMSQLPFANIGIQVETKGQKEDTTQGSQLNKLDGTDLYEDGVPIDFAPGSKTRMEEWDSLSEGEKEVKSPIHKIYSKLTKAKIALIETRYKKVLKRLDIREENGRFVLGKESRQKVADFILAELERRQLPMNTADAISSGRIDFESIANYKQIRDILYSIIDKEIVRPKINGAPHVQIPVTGWEIERRQVNGKNVLVSNRLKFYDLKDGKTQACQILLPNRFRGIPLGSIDPELLKGIGFRIPTQGLNSVEYFEVVGFLPEDMGDVVIFPTEITTKAGSDFDIDKMNLYIKNFYIDNGRAVELKWQGSEEATRDYLMGLVKRKLFLTKAERQFSDSVNNLIDDIFETAEQKVDELYEQVLQNAYLDELMVVISLPENFAKLVSPNTQEFFSDGSKGLKKIAEDIVDLKTADKDKDANKKKGTDYDRLLDSGFMTQTRHNFIIGKTGVGVDAVSGTNLIVNQVSRVLIPWNKAISFMRGSKASVSSLPFKMNTVVYGEETYLSLGQVTDASGKINLANSGSQFTDGHVDIAKGAWIIDLGADDDQAATYLFMNKSGIHPEVYSKFLNQPIIQDFIKARKNQEAAIAAGIISRRKTVKKMVNDVLIKYKKGSSHREISKPMVYDVSEMEAIIKKVANKIELSEYEKNLQRFMIQDFLLIETLKWELYRIVQGYNYDTQKINDRNMHYRKQLQTQAAQDSGIIVGIDNVFANTFIGSVRTAVDKLNTALSETFFKLHHGKSRTVLNSIADEIMQIKRLKIDEYKNLMDRAESTLLNYLISTGNQFKGKSMIEFQKKLMFDKEHSVAHFITAMKKSNDINLQSNSFLENLIPSIDPRKDYPNVVYMKDIAYDAITANNFTDDFRRLLNDHTPIKVNDKTKTISEVANNLVLLGIIQYGTIPTRRSFNKLIPYELYEKYTSNITEFSDNLDTFKKLDMFYRRNWDNDTLVPPVPMEVQEDQQGNIRFKFPVYNGLIRLREYNNEPYRFVKTVEYKKIEKDGKQVPDYDNPIVTLYKRVENADGVPVIKEVATDPTDPESTERMYYYKPTIKYGTPYLDEFHTRLEPSIFGENAHVIREQTDFEANKVIFPDRIEDLKQEFGIVSPVEQVDDSSIRTINIYAGTNENAHLSNFAERPIKDDGITDIGIIYESATGKVLTFKTPEGLYQANKLNYVDVEKGGYWEDGYEITEKGIKLIEQFANASGSQAKALGRTIQGLDVAMWDEASENIMRDVMKASFEQNPEAAKSLLATGNAVLTHTQDKSKWGNLFPKILTEIRTGLQDSDLPPFTPDEDLPNDSCK